MEGFTRISDHATAVEWFSRWMTAQRPDVSELRGENLACWCKPGAPCHADILLHWANAGTVQSGPEREPGILPAGIILTMKPKKKKKETKKKWSGQVTKKSNAMDLKKDVFKQTSPTKIAKSVKAAASKSTRRKAAPKRSAMSMLSFYENRAGKNLSAAQRKKIDKAKDELRKLPE
jgi:hypothetical protein